MTAFAKNLKNFRGSMSQEELAEKTTYKQSEISKFEGGTREPNIAGLILLAKALGVTVDELIGRC
jgi:transcriptional regulator with XRE-family HTH domain